MSTFTTLSVVLSSLVLWFAAISLSAPAGHSLKDVGVLDLCENDTSLCEGPQLIIDYPDLDSLICHEEITPTQSELQPRVTWEDALDVSHGILCILIRFLLLSACNRLSNANYHIIIKMSVQ